MAPVVLEVVLLVLNTEHCFLNTEQRSEPSLPEKERPAARNKREQLNIRKPSNNKHKSNYRNEGKT